MEQRFLSIVSVICILVSSPAMGKTLEAPLSALFQYSPIQLGRSVTSSKSAEPFIPHLIFKRDYALNQMGQVALGNRCGITAVQSDDQKAQGYFNAPLSVAPGGKISATASYEMSLISYQQELLKIKLLSAKESPRQLELTCTHTNILDWTISQFESELKHGARVYASAKLADFKIAPRTGQPEHSLSSLTGSFFNGLFGSGLPGTTGIQLLLGANLKAYADEMNAPLMVGKKCKLLSQDSAAFSDHYLKGSKFAFREIRMNGKNKVEFIFDNWNHSPHQLKVECRGEMNDVKHMTLAQVEHDLNGTIQFYQK
jgi:hypothetical protein